MEKADAGGTITCSISSSFLSGKNLIDLSFRGGYFKRNKLQLLNCYLLSIHCNVNFYRIVEIITSSPLGMQLTTLSYHGGIYQRNVTWYPSQQQIGQQVFCFKGVDSAG